MNFHHPVKSRRSLITITGSAADKNYTELNQAEITITEIKIQNSAQLQNFISEITPKLFLSKPQKMDSLRTNKVVNKNLILASAASSNDNAFVEKRVT